MLIAKCPCCEMVCDVNSTKTTILQFCLFRIKIIYFGIYQLGITMFMLVQRPYLLCVNLSLLSFKCGNKSLSGAFTCFILYHFGLDVCIFCTHIH